jgi:hypothetical protein
MGLTEPTKNTYDTLDTFFKAIESSEIDKSDLVMHFDNYTFYAMDVANEHEYFSGDFEEVYAWFESILKLKGITVVYDDGTRYSKEG